MGSAPVGWEMQRNRSRIMLVVRSVPIHGTRILEEPCVAFSGRRAISDPSVPRSRPSDLSAIRALVTVWEPSPREETDHGTDTFGEHVHPRNLRW
jgi:hypothetical protein